MPLKPFNPPRPRTSTSSNNDSSTKPRGRPKSTSTSAKPTKSSKTNTRPTKEQKKLANARFSASGLPSLSPETRRELEGTSDEEEDGEEDASDVEMVDGEEDDDPFASQPLPKPKSKSRTSTTHKARKSDIIELGSDGEIDIDGEDGDGDEGERNEKIPEDLLNVILHQFFRQEGTRMHKDANRAVGRYMEVFVREGIARAVWGREEGGRGGGLEVEDLEKLAPQLILDF